MDFKGLASPFGPLAGQAMLSQADGMEADGLQAAMAAAPNGPALWLRAFPFPDPDGHKYDRGHALAVSGPMHRTGAARLAARAALRTGAGLVTLASPPDALMINAAHLTAVMLVPMEGALGLGSILADSRFTALCLGPALGIGQGTRELVATALAAERATVLDADALTSFEVQPEALFARIRTSAAPVVLTPHEGEFARLFGPVAADRIGAARRAARQSGAVVVLKGPRTVIAGPGGRAAVQMNAPAELATAGSGDVLAGIVLGLLAQGMPGFEAAAAAVWLHAMAAERFGPGLISEDIEAVIPPVLTHLLRLRDHGQDNRQA
jgi:ADP-dependent NAD(P)H-hydrate dehydratase / NAD(P)H-hydrate epimerase